MYCLVYSLDCSASDKFFWTCALLSRCAQALNFNRLIGQYI